MTAAQSLQAEGALLQKMTDPAKILTLPQGLPRCNQTPDLGSPSEINPRYSNSGANIALVFHKNLLDIQTYVW
jgi:hypothetical protein